MPEDRIGLSYYIDLAAFQDSSRKFKKIFTDLNSWIEQSAGKVKSATTSANEELKKLGITSNMTSGDIKNLKLSAIDVQRAFELTKKRMAELRKEVAGGGISSKAAAREFKVLQDRLPALQHEVNAGIKAFGDYRRAMDRIGGGFKYMIASQAAWIASGFAIFGTLRALTQGFKDVGAVHQELRNLMAVTGSTTDEIKTMEIAIRQASVGTKFFAADMTKAATIMGQAGFSAREVSDSIGAVAVLASATGRDLTDVAELMTTVIRAYGLNASESFKVANALAAGIRRSKLQIEDLRTAFNYMGAAAHMFNISLEDTVSWLGVLRDRGLKASTIGTSFRGVLAALVNETGKFSKVLKDVGLSFSDISIKRGRTLEQALTRLRDASFNANHAFQGLNRRTAMTFSMMVNNVDVFKKLTREITGTNDAIDMNRITMTGLQSQWDQIKSIFDDFMLSLTRSGGALEDFVMAFKTIVQVLASTVLLLAGVIDMIAKSIAMAAAAVNQFSEVKITLPSGPTAEMPNAPDIAGKIRAPGLKGAFDEYIKDLENTGKSVRESIKNLFPKGIFGDVLTKDEKQTEQLKSTLKELLKEKDNLLERFRSGSVKQGTKDYEDLTSALLLVNQRIRDIMVELKLMDESITGPIRSFQDVMTDIAIKPGQSLEQMLGTFRKGAQDVKLMEKAVRELRIEALDLTRRFSEREFFKGSAEYERMIALLKELGKAQKALDAAKKKSAKEIETEMAKAERDIQNALNAAIRTASSILDVREKLTKESLTIDNKYASLKKQILRDLARQEIDDYEEAITVAKLNIDEKTRLLKQGLERQQKLIDKVREASKRDPVLLGQLEVEKQKLEEMKKLFPFITLLREKYLENIGAPKDISKGLRHGMRDATKDLNNEYQIWKDSTKETAYGMKDTLKSVFFDSMNHELKSGADYWKAFTNIVKQQIAEIAAAWITSGIFDLGGKGIAKGIGFISSLYASHQGGYQTPGGGTFRLMKMHSGGMNSDEYLKILRKGEYELRPWATKSIGVSNLDYMNRTGQMPNQGHTVIDNRRTINYIQAMDVQSFDQFIRKNGAKAVSDLALGSFSRARRMEDRRLR